MLVNQIKVLENNDKVSLKYTEKDGYEHDNLIVCEN